MVETTAGEPTFAEVFCQLRERAGYTPVELALMLDVSLQALTKIESGEHAPPHRNEFYFLLRSFAGYGPQALADLFATPDAPRWFIGIAGDTNAIPGQDASGHPVLTVTLRVDNGIVSTREEAEAYLEELAEELREALLRKRDQPVLS